jgi:cytochrome c5
MKTSIGLLLLAAGVWLVSGSAAYGAERFAEDGQGLFEQKCGTCHTASRSTSQQKTAREWQRTVSRMKNVHGASITDDEAKTIVEYLAKNHGA